MEKTFDHRTRESEIYARWNDAGLFRVPDSANDADPFTIVIPPPNVTGRLHIGHALNNTLQDIMVRWHRANGRPTLWQPGTDHAGIATQMVVERQLEAQGESRAELGREEFLRRVWAWKAESGGAIVGQLSKLGASADWERERFTMDEGLSAGVLKAFVDLYEEGYIYRANRLVNWDPHFETAISDLEIAWREQESNYWHIRYRLAPEAFDAELAATRNVDDLESYTRAGNPVVAKAFAAAEAAEEEEYIVIATRRPETMFADAGVAVHPEDPRWQGLIGRHCFVPETGRCVPIVADEFVDPSEGSGAVKITPAHDFGDFDVAQRHGMACFSIFDSTARLVSPAPTEYVGLTREDARTKLVEQLESKGDIVQTDTDMAKIPYGDRSGVPIEPRLTTQWFVRAEELARRAQTAANEGHIRFHPAGWKRTWDAWLDNIQPWCISRQLWWGHQIPAWFTENDEVIVAMSEDEALAKAQAKFGPDVQLRRDPDVLDTWFSSALWPFSTLGWPDTTDRIYQQHFPTSVLVTGFDILFFWVARMVMFSLHFHRDRPIEQAIPFRDVYIHALVRDQHGQKMSKSKGNVVDPLDMVEQYGADAFRFGLASLAAPGRDVRLLPSQFEWSKHVITKTWNAVRFVVNSAEITSAPAAITHPYNRWIVAEYHTALATLERQHATFRYDLAAITLYDFIWGTFCDWYVELIKPLLKEDAPTRPETSWVVRTIARAIASLLHPFAPFISQAMWDELGSTSVLMYSAPWAATEYVTENDPAVQATEVTIGLIREIRSLRALLQLEQIDTTLQLPADCVAHLQFSVVPNTTTDLAPTIARMARLKAIAPASTSDAGNIVRFLSQGYACGLEIDGTVDMAAMRARLTDKMDFLKKQIGKLGGRLDNTGFRANATAEVVAETEKKHAEAKTELARLESLMQ